jgi:hypothetical protein
VVAKVFVQRGKEVNSSRGVSRFLNAKVLRAPQRLAVVAAAAAEDRVEPCSEAGAEGETEEGLVLCSAVAVRALGRVGPCSVGEMEEGLHHPFPQVNKMQLTGLAA